MPRTVTQTRDRMIRSAALLIRERGARATSIDDVLAHSGAPRGSVYHHFPGGRDELLREATAFAGDAVSAVMRGHGAGGPAAAFDALLAGYREQLLASEFRAGCPVLAVAIEDRDDGVQAAAGAVLAGWTAELAAGLEDAGVAPGRAATLATVAIAATEGALAMARAQRDPAPLDHVRAGVGALLAHETGAPAPTGGSA